jgi:hypothetical protein
MHYLNLSGRITNILTYPSGLIILRLLSKDFHFSDAGYKKMVSGYVSCSYFFERDGIERDDIFRKNYYVNNY